VNLHQLHFANPAWLNLIFLLPLIPLLFFFADKAKRSTLFLGNPRLVEMSFGVLKVKVIPWALRFTVIFLCLLGAAHPQGGQRKVEKKTPVTDLFVALDVSSSMLSDDLQPNRITAAKNLLSRFLDKVKNARVGLSVFAAISFTQCPMTTDIGVVKALLGNVDVGSVKIDRTAIGDALAACLNRLQQGTGRKDDHSNPPSLVSRWLPGEGGAKNHQAIILLTDGGNNYGSVDPLMAAKLAVSQGVKIYTIGIGTPEGVPAFYIDQFGRKQYAFDEKGHLIKDAMDQTLLKEIARISGGKFFIGSDNHSLQSVLNEIAKLEKRDMVTVTDWEYQEWTPYFLLAAFLLLALDILLETTVLRTLP